MVANRQQGLLRVVARNEANIAPTAAGFSAPPSGNAQRLEAAAAQSGALQRELAGFANQIGALADHAASVEGGKAGKPAGLDPEFRPLNDGTIYGEAYDRAGLQSYSNNVRIEIEKDIASGGDLQQKQTGWLKQVPEELRPEVTFMFKRAEVVQARKAARAEEARVRSEATGSLATQLDEATKSLHQRAFDLGLDPIADEILQTDLGLLKQRLAQVGPSGLPLVAPATQASELLRAKSAINDARLLGAFDRLPSNQARIAFINRLEEDFRNSKGIAKSYDLPGFQRITRQLSANLNAQLAQARQVESGVRNEMKALKRAAEKGFAPSPDQLAGLRARLELGVATPEAKQQFARLEDLASLQTDLRASKPQRVQAYIEAEQIRMGEKGPDPQSLDRLDMAKKFLTEMRKELERDQLGWADRVGYSKVPDLDFSDEANLAVSLQTRIAQAEDISRNYHGTNWKEKVQYLKSAERAQLAAVASLGGDQTMDIAGVIAKYVDDDRAPRILGELFNEAPVVAVLGSLVARTGKTAIARDIADGIALSKTEFKPVGLPTPVQARMAANEVHKGAFSNFAKDEAAVISATDFAYQVIAQRRRITTYDEKLWKQTFRKTIGETTGRDRETYGGISVGRQGFFGIGGPGAVVVPANVKNSGFHELIKSITLADINAAYDGNRPPSDFADSRPRYVVEGRVGPPVSEGDFRAAELVQYGDGQYLMNLGDADDPQYFADRNGKFFVLDLNKLEERMRERKPELYLGGGPVSRVQSFTQVEPATTEQRAIELVATGDEPLTQELRPVPLRVPEPNAPNDDRTPAAKNGMISGTAVHMPDLVVHERALEAIQAYELGRESIVTADDYAKMMPLMDRVYISDGLDDDAADQLVKLFEEIERR